jgi:hypothetical protein
MISRPASGGARETSAVGLAVGKRVWRGQSPTTEHGPYHLTPRFVRVARDPTRAGDPDAPINEMPTSRSYLYWVQVAILELAASALQCVGG